MTTVVLLKNGQHFEVEEPYKTVKAKYEDPAASDSSLIELTKAYGRGSRVSFRRDAIASFDGSDHS